jgi:hypothetical protein
MNPPRLIVFYTDRMGISPLAEQLEELDWRVVDKVEEKNHYLSVSPWPDLFKSRLVKELKGCRGIYEYRITGSGAFGLRITFFATTCRGANELVLLVCEKRGDLSGILWKRFIARAERLREDWEQRNCGGTGAR